MSLSIIKAVLSKDISVDTIKLWFFEAPEIMPAELEKFNCTRGKFAFEFVNLLRDDCQWILHSWKENNTEMEMLEKFEYSNTKKKDQYTFPQTSIIHSIPNEKHDTSSMTTSFAEHNKSLENVNKPRSQSANNSSFNLGDFILSSNSQGKEKKKHKQRGKCSKVHTLSCPSERSRLDIPLVSSLDSKGSVSSLSYSIKSNLEQESPMFNNILTHTPKDILSSNIAVGIPVPKLVSYAEKLDLLCEIYCFFLDNNLVVNLMAEIVFVISLLLINETKYSGNASDILNEDKTNLGLLKTIHNCVYFAASVLEHQKHVLCVLDRNTLDLFRNNERLLSFVPDMFLHISNLNDEDYTHPTNQFHVSPIRTHVTFQAETDNRQNFPNELTFHSFRKQRDQFYEILSIWEKEHLVSSWSFHITLAGRIKDLLNSCNNPWNLFHFARLFRSQLQLSCLYDSKIFDDDRDMIGPPYKDMAIIITKRFDVLGTRSTFNPLTCFTGPQEFYRDFIIFAATTSTAFIQHLLDNMIDELLSLNRTVFTASDLEDSGKHVDEETRNSYKYCLSQTMILAKFIGYIVYLPYYSNFKVVGSILESHRNLRASRSPPLDIMKCLESAITAKNLVLTLPWIVEFLSMMDEVSCQLPYNLSLFEKLFEIYYDWTYLARNSFEIHGFVYPQLSISLVTFLLGWLFDTLHTPVALYFSWRFGKPLPSTHQGMCGHLGSSIDILDIVDRKSLYLCCPFIRDVRLLLGSHHSEISPILDSCIEKRVLPSSVDFIISEHFENSVIEKNKMLEMKLRETFFHSQPASIRKTVDLVTERVASCCAKFLCLIVLPPIKKAAISDFIEFFRESGIQAMTVSSLTAYHLEIKDILNKGISILSRNYFNELKDQCFEIAQNFCKERSRSALEALLPIDFDGLDICVSISYTGSLKKTSKWMLIHFSPDMFETELRSEMEKNVQICLGTKKYSKSSHDISSKTLNRKCVDQVLCPNQSLMEIADLIRRILDDRGSDQIETEITNLLGRLTQSIQNHENNTSSAEQILFSPLTLTLLLAQVAHQPNTVTPKILNNFVIFWSIQYLTLSNPLDDVLKRIVCPHTVKMLVNSERSQELVWTCLADMFVYLEENKLISPQSISKQFLEVLQYPWPQEYFKYFRTCLCKISSLSSNCFLEFELMKLKDLCEDATYNNKESF